MRIAASLFHLTATLVATALAALEGCAVTPLPAPAPAEFSAVTTNASTQWIIRLKPGISPTKYAQQSGLRYVRSIGAGMHRYAGASPLRALQTTPGAVWVEADHPVRAPRIDGQDIKARPIARTVSYGPNDPLLPAQYSYHTLNADRFWLKQTGTPNCVVAIIDSGIDARHPDLQGACVPGWDLTVTPPQSGGLEDPYGHGTHVAGIVGARTNNAIGIAGLAPGCKLLPVKIFNQFGHSTAGITAEAIVWAVDHGAKVINCSWGTPLPGEATMEAVRYAMEKDVVVVAASGNSGKNDGLNYPAAQDGVIAVAASTDIDGWASFSTWGDWVDLAAPGESILSTFPTARGTGYRLMRGTSMAAPHVTAAAALLRSDNPALTQAQVADVLYSTAKDIVRSGFDPYSGHGRVDPARALGL
ncbi:MAG: S8 family serine peptidase [Candidatus Sericytochromatia bacterium]|nr:S8 family serine peptidase [Candidatus Sericytochromatia bacterium]